MFQDVVAKACEYKNLFIVEKDSKFAGDLNTAEITVASKNPVHPQAIEELQSVDARNLAIKFAGMNGMSDARVSSMALAPYPVNRKGIPLEKVAEAAGKVLPPQHEDMQVSGYKLTISLMRKL